MKKKIIGFLTGALTLGALAVPVFAEPSMSCYSQITNAGHTSMGVTSCGVAELCQVSHWAYFSGGEKSASSSGIVATTATVHVNAPDQFYSSRSEHRVDAREHGSLNTYRRTSSASY